MSNHQEMLDVLLKEHGRMCTETRAIEANNEKAIAFGLSVVTAAFAVGVAQHVHQIFFVIPAALVGVFFYVAMMYTYVFSMGGYKRFLEDRINDLLGERIMLWERMVEIRQHDNLIRPALVAIYLAIGLTIGGLSVADIYSQFGFTVMAGVTGVTIVLLIILIFTLRRMLQMYDRIYGAAQSEFKTKLHE